MQLGDLGRAAGWLQAVRHAGRPTQSFQATVIYRRLRDAIGTTAPDVPDGDDLDDIGRAALAWLADQA